MLYVLISQIIGELQNATHLNPNPMDYYDVEAHERVFHNRVRDFVVGFLLFFLFTSISHIILCAFKRKPEKDEYSVAYEDAVVCRLSLAACTFTVTTSLGAILILPMSICANEAVLYFPNNYYLQWINSSLIDGLWNGVFLSSNLCLFVLMPFAYFLVESEGLPGSRRGIMPRVYEALLVLILFCLVLCGLAGVMLALTSGSNSQFLFEIFLDIKNVYLLYLYSCVSFLGVAMLLVCTPLGFTRLFSLIGEAINAPDELQEKFDGDLERAIIEEAAWVLRHQSIVTNNVNGYHPVSALIVQRRKKAATAAALCPSEPNSATGTAQPISSHLASFRSRLERNNRRTRVGRKFFYPLTMLVHFVSMSASLLMVVVNTCELLVNGKVFKYETSEELTLGVSSLSSMGPIGAGVEIVIIFYLMITSMVGFYSLPGCRKLRPKCKDTPITILILNCMIILVLSSALPVLCRTLGITNFDLLGNYGQLEWLEMTYIILAYNIIFVIVVAICLINRYKISANKIRKLFNISSQSPLCVHSSSVSTAVSKSS